MEKTAREAHDGCPQMQLIGTMKPVYLSQRKPLHPSFCFLQCPTVWGHHVLLVSDYQKLLLTFPEGRHSNVCACGHDFGTSRYSRQDLAKEWPLRFLGAWGNGRWLHVGSGGESSGSPAPQLLPGEQNDLQWEAGKVHSGKAKRPEGTILTLAMLTVKVCEHSSCLPKTSVELWEMTTMTQPQENWVENTYQENQVSKVPLGIRSFFLKKVFESISTVSDDLVICNI